MGILRLRKICSKKDLQEFYGFSSRLYGNSEFYRSTEEDIVRMLVEKKSVYFRHADLHSYLVYLQDKIVARFSLIHDEKLPDHVQVGFFDALENVEGLDQVITGAASELYPSCKKILYGLNAHLNYGAGFLISHFDKIPVFGLPYNHPWYMDYFKDHREYKMVSRTFPSEHFFEFLKNYPVKDDSIVVRFMDKKHLKREVGIYTRLNNECFQEHLFWADRMPEEDLELFGPFSLFLDNENLIFAETKDGKPIGFLLWYPDFNQIVNKPHSQLGLFELLKFRLANPVKNFRFTEIAVHPEYKNRPVSLMMMQKLSAAIEKTPYMHGEGGFIFEENYSSMNLVQRFFDRHPFDESLIRYYAVYEKDLV